MSPWVGLAVVLLGVLVGTLGIRTTRSDAVFALYELISVAIIVVGVILVVKGDPS